MTAHKIKLQYITLKKRSYDFKCLKYIYLFQKYLGSQKNPEYSTLPLFYWLIFDMTLGLKK